jgi:hypothetical protein
MPDEPIFTPSALPPERETVTLVPYRLDAPAYAGLIATIAEIAVEAVTAAPEPRPLIADLGAGRGAQIKAVLTRLGDAATYVGFEDTAELLEVARSALSREITSGRIMLSYHDLLLGLPTFPQPPLAMIFGLCLRPLPPQARERRLSEARAALAPGGRVVVVETVTDPQHDAGLAQSHREHRTAHGHRGVTVPRRRALSGGMTRLSISAYEDMFARAGFNAILRGQAWSLCVWALEPHARAGDVGADGRPG